MGRSPKASPIIINIVTNLLDMYWMTVAVSFIYLICFMFLGPYEMTKEMWGVEYDDKECIYGILYCLCISFFLSLIPVYNIWVATQAINESLKE